MRVLDAVLAILTKAGVAIPNLEAGLEDAIARYPDLAPLLGPLDQALKLPVDVAGVTDAVVSEAGQIVQFKFDGREHPSDAF